MQRATTTTMATRGNGGDDENEQQPQAGMAGLPGELAVQIMRLAGGQHPLEAIGLCETHPMLRPWCREPLFDASALAPTIRRNLPVARPIASGGNQMVSLMEIARARAQRDAMRRCVMYALYSLYALVGPTNDPPFHVPLVPFDPNKSDDEWAALVMPLMRHPAKTGWVGYVYIDLSGYTVSIGTEGRMFRNNTDSPREQDYAAVNHVLTQALVRAVLETSSEADTPAVCASIDIRRAYLDDPQLPNGPYISHGASTTVLDAVKIAHLWYPWTHHIETFESALHGEPLYVYDNGSLRRPRHERKKRAYRVSNRPHLFSFLFLQPTGAADGSRRPEASCIDIDCAVWALVHEVSKTAKKITTGRNNTPFRISVCVLTDVDSRCLFFFGSIGRAQERRQTHTIKKCSFFLW